MIMSNPSEQIVPDSEHRGIIGLLPGAARPFALLARFDRPIGWWLLFWPCAWGVALAGAPCRESRWDRWLGLATGSTGPAQIRPPLARGDFSGFGRCEPGCHSYGYKRAHGREELRGAGGGARGGCGRGE